LSCIKIKPAMQQLFVTLSLEEFKTLLSQVVREEISHLPPAPETSDSERLYTLKDACKFLGVSRPTVYALMKAGKLRYAYLSRNRLRFTKADLVAYVEGRISHTS
jgi:excisionase family DNA binding protein